jgi:hypothetical protein
MRYFGSWLLRGCLAALLLAGSVPANASASDISLYVPAAKGQLFDQFTSGAPTLSATGFMYQASATGSGSNTVLNASVLTPGGSNLVLTLTDPATSKFQIQSLFIDQPSLDTVFTNGTYQMTIVTTNDGTLTPALDLTGDDYPNPPQVLNFDAAQVIETSTNFVFVWGSFTNGTTNDAISFEIDDGSGNTITNTPDIGQPGQLDGTVTNFTIAAGMLTAGTTNTGHLEFIKVTASDTNSVPGALGITGYFAETQFSIMVNTTVCVFAISPTNATFDATGGSGGINVTATDGCAWTATNNDSFITIDSGSSGSGNGMVSYTVAANTSSNELTGTITIAGQTFSITEQAPCAFSLDSTSADFDASGGDSNVAVTANSTNCAWTAISNSGFITITAGNSGSGNGTVSYTVATNTDADAIDQTGSMTIAGQTYTITQAAAACAFTLDFTNADLTADGASGDITFTANGTNCAWTAVSNDSFITITNGPSGASGVGDGTVTVTVDTNTDTVARTGTLTIAGQTFIINEDAADCVVSIESTAANFSAAGGSSNVVVTTNGTNCDWTAASSNNFITITSDTNGLGSGSVSYTVAANTGTARTVTMTIADQTFTTHQAGATLDFALTNVAQTCRTRIVRRTSTTNTTCAVNFNLVVSNTGVANTPAFYALIWLKQGSVFDRTVGVVFQAKRVRALKIGKSAKFRIRKSGISGDQAGTFLFVTDIANNVLASAEIPNP